MDFPTIESLLTLDQAKTAYGQLFDAYQALGTSQAKAAADIESVTAQLETLKAESAATLEVEQERVLALEEDLASANALLDEAGKEKAALIEKNAQSESKILDAAQKLAENVQELQAAQTRIAALEAEAKSAEAKAAQICASVGVDPVQITPSGDTSKSTLLEQMRSITNPAEQMDFFRKNREAILRGA